MAQLIPSYIDDRTPPGERDVYNLLANGPDDWVALHALDIAPWNRGLRTEIDFVVLIPDTGILCIEVKSHEAIAFENGRWEPESIKRSPFKQAIDATAGFFRRLRNIAPHLSKVPVVHCCIFPRASFSIGPNLAVQPWELMDARAFRRLTKAQDFCHDLRERAQKSIAIDTNISPLEKHLSNQQVDFIAGCCLPVRRNRPDVREEIRRREEQAEGVLRQQQKPILQLANQNDRIIVSGGAGTGKTLIAMEVARREADKGGRVALLCFNRLVGDWMRQRMEAITPALPNLVVGRATQVMATMTSTAVPDNAPPDFWNVELPQRLEDRLTDPDFKAAATFDYLVLDEAQDLLARPNLWNCLQQFLSGGIDKGRFFLCGDFEHQVLSDRGPIEASLEAIRTVGHPACWQLTENCRNYRIVGNTAVALSGFKQSVYTDYMRSGGGVRNFDIAYYESDESQIRALASLLKECKSAGYRPSDISVLSFRSDDASAGSRLRDPGVRLRPAFNAGDATGYSSVHAFKGMENKVVILTDVVLGTRDFQRDLFYTGMTRATESVRILCAKGSQRALLKWLAGDVTG